jgi:hypothetical protein
MLIPPWYDNQIAGYAFAVDAHHPPIAIHDPNTGYFLVRSSDGKGSFLQLILTQDRKLVSGLSVHDSYDRSGTDRMEWRHLRKLTTGRGIPIGTTRHHVLAILGRPTSITRIGRHHEYIEYDYQSASGGVELIEAYTFKRQTLLQIEFTRELTDY